MTIYVKIDTQAKYTNYTNYTNYDYYGYYTNREIEYSKETIEVIEENNDKQEEQTKENNDNNNSKEKHKVDDKKYQLALNDYYINKLVELIWCEDRTSIDNAKDVLSVIVNRAKSKNIKDILVIAAQRYQFSCYNNPNTIEKQVANKLDLEMRDKIRELVVAAIHGKFTPTHNGTHYYAYNKIKKPKWASKMVIVKKNNNHIFLAKLEERS
jgi:hypothetical protein